MDHPPYSLDLTPSDFDLFLHLKNFLALQTARSRSHLEHWLNAQVVALYDEGIQILVSHHDKCLNSSGNCEEK
jgi:hypothetical protein